MTSRHVHVRLEVMVDASDPTLCGHECVYLAEDHENWSGACCDLFNDDICQDAAEEPLKRLPKCLAATIPTTADALNAAVVEAAKRWRDADYLPTGLAAIELAVDAMRSAEQKETP